MRRIITVKQLITNPLNLHVVGEISSKTRLVFWNCVRDFNRSTLVNIKFKSSIINNDKVRKQVKRTFF